MTEFDQKRAFLAAIDVPKQTLCTYPPNLDKFRQPSTKNPPRDGSSAGAPIEYKSRRWRRSEFVEGAEASSRCHTHAPQHRAKHAGVASNVRAVATSVLAPVRLAPTRMHHSTERGRRECGSQLREWALPLSEWGEGTAQSATTQSAGRRESGARARHRAGGGGHGRAQPTESCSWQATAAAFVSRWYNSQRDLANGAKLAAFLVCCRLPLEVVHLLQHGDYGHHLR